MRVPQAHSVARPIRNARAFAQSALCQNLESTTLVVFTVIIAVRMQPTMMCAAPRPLSLMRLAIMTPSAMQAPTRAA